MSFQKNLGILLSYMLFTSVAQSQITISDGAIAGRLMTEYGFSYKESGLTYVADYDQEMSLCLSKDISSTRKTSFHQLQDRNKYKQCQDITLAKIQNTVNINRNLHQKFETLYKQQHSSTAQLPQLDKPTLGIIGDSFATGALADLKIKPSLLPFLRNAIGMLTVHAMTDWLKTQPPKLSMIAEPELFNIVDRGQIRVAPLLRIYDTPEFPIGTGYWGRLYEQREGSFVDCNECSYGYFVGRGLGFLPQNIIMAARDGERIHTLAMQFARLALPLDNKLPELVLISYGGYDMCHPDNAKRNYQIAFDDYYSKMLNGLKEAFNKYKSANTGTRIIIFSVVNAKGLLTSPSILQRSVPIRTHATDIATGVVNTILPKKISVAENNYTCEDLRRNRLNLTKAINNLCKYVMHVNIDDPKQLEHLHQINRGIWHAQRQVVKDINQYLSENNMDKQFSVQLIEQTAKIEFTGQDVAHDCIHPSIHGHEKTAREILKALKSN